MDKFKPEKRSQIMAKIRGSNTAPEKRVRTLLHETGYRYRLNVEHLPGKPDIVMPKHKKIIFVHGCFWHGHNGCKRAKRPSTNRKFWDKKIDSNIERDKKIKKELTSKGWKVLIVWQCETGNTVRLRRKLLKFLN